MSKNNEWSAVDVAATLLSRDSDRDREGAAHSSSIPVEASPGFHPGQGRYIVDPDYQEMLGLDDFEQLIQYHK